MRIIFKKFNCFGMCQMEGLLNRCERVKPDGIINISVRDLVGMLVESALYFVFK